MDNRAQPNMFASEAFKVHLPAVAFEKADAPQGQKRRIAGIISTEEVDQQNERLLQDGLNFDGFLKSGTYNHEHEQGPANMLGYPLSVQSYKKGDALPNGERAQANLTWAEGFLCGSKGRDVWELARDLEGSGRTLGFSVEGSINSRDAGDRNIVTSADVNHCAVCIRPINKSCTLVPLAKSLRKAHEAAKAFTMGTVPPQSGDNPIPQPTPNEPKSGEGAGQVLSAIFKNKDRLRKKGRKSGTARKSSAAATTTKPVARKASSPRVGQLPVIAKSEDVEWTTLARPDDTRPILLNAQEAVHWVRKAVPGVEDATALAFVETAQRFVAMGLA